MRLVRERNVLSQAVPFSKELRNQHGMTVHCVRFVLTPLATPNFLVEHGFTEKALVENYVVRPSLAMMSCFIDAFVAGGLPGPDPCVYCKVHVAVFQWQDRHAYCD